MRVATGLQAAAWLVAGAWIWKLVTTARGNRLVPDLLSPEFDGGETALPSLAVIVPARNEEADIEQSIRALLALQYPRLEIVAIDDRSTDGTGEILRTLAAEEPGRLRVIEIMELPTGWLGKTHAMALAAGQTEAEYLLFSDADVIFHPEALRRSMRCALRERADHLVTLPTTVIHRWDEAMMLGFLQMLGTWAVRLWKVADSGSRDALGVGAFNLVRREAYEQVGGFTALRMEILEDVGLARRIKAAGLRSRVAFGRGLVSLHWASGARGIVEVMTKNMFAAFRFHPSLVLLTAGWLVGSCVLPFAAIFWPATALAGFATLAAVVGLYRVLGRHSGIEVRYALLTPAAASIFLYAMLRSMAYTLVQGGVRWRGTFYPLAELRREAAPLPRTGWRRS